MIDKNLGAPAEKKGQSMLEKLEDESPVKKKSCYIDPDSNF